MSKTIKTIIRTVAFLALFGFLLYWVQDIVQPDHDWPSISRRTTKGIDGYLVEPKDSLGIVWIGTSHVMYGVSPMEVYRETGVTSYNFATIGQNLPETYDLLKLALERQSPKIVVLDMSAAFFDESRVNANGIWQEIIDCVPWSELDNKLDMLMDLAKLNDKQSDLEYLMTKLFPIVRYHSDVINGKASYVDLHLGQLYQRKGFTTESKIRAFNTKNTKTVEALLTNMYDLGEDEGPNPVLREQLDYNLDILHRIQELCKAHGSELVFTKIPVHATRNYKGYWSLEKHNMIQALADDMGVPFVDLVFEDVGLDWATDTCDSAAHMNYQGAMKVTAFLTDWLKANYDTAAMAQGYNKASWDAQLKFYDWEMAYYRMQMDRDLLSYLETIADFNYTLFVSATGDVASFWNDALQAAFARATGSAVDLRGVGSAAYVCASDNGELLAEKSDPASASTKGKLTGGASYELTSQSDTKRKGSVKVDGREMATQDPGLRLVLFDNDLGCVVDSAFFSASSGSVVGKHTNRNYTESFKLALIERAAQDAEQLP